MGDFVVEKSEDGKIPRIEVPTNLDAKVFVLGHGNLLGKNIIQEFFNCVGNLPLDDASILKKTTNYGDAISLLVLKLERKFIRTHPTLQRLFYELPVIKNPRAKKIATLVLMNEFDDIVREAREIFDFYGMNREKPVIDEILYDKDYLLRHLFHDNHTFDENTKKEVPPMHIIQQVFNGINKQFSWIVSGNQGGYEETQLANAKIPLDDVFFIAFEKPLAKSSSTKSKDDNT
jgi:hypothetical protein